MPGNAWGKVHEICRRTKPYRTISEVLWVRELRPTHQERVPCLPPQRAVPLEENNPADGSAVISCVARMRSSGTVRRSFREPPQTRLFANLLCSGRAFPQALTAAPFLFRERADPPKRASLISIVSFPAQEWSGPALRSSSSGGNC